MTRLLPSNDEGAVIELDTEKKYHELVSASTSQLVRTKEYKVLLNEILLEIVMETVEQDCIGDSIHSL
jgi:hypothetical protein